MFDMSVQQQTPTSAASSWIIERRTAHDDVDQTLRRFEEQLGLQPPSSDAAVHILVSEQSNDPALEACQRRASSLVAALRSKDAALNALTEQLRTLRALQVWFVVSSTTCVVAIMCAHTEKYRATAPASDSSSAGPRSNACRPACRRT